jgi:hypothetical protein
VPDLRSRLFHRPEESILQRYSDAEKEIRLSACERHEFAANQLAEFDFIHVAPDPGLSRFIRPDQRVLAAMKVFGCVLVLG